MSNFKDKSAAFERKLNKKAIAHLVKQLGTSVSEKSIKSFRVGYSKDDKAFTSPEVDGTGQVVGILRRNTNGKGEKRAVQSSNRALAIPIDFDEFDGPILVPEGVTDSMALHGAGCAVVGRPSAFGGVRHLEQFFSDQTDREIIIIGDNDKKNGAWPGSDGAIKTAQQLATSMEVAIQVGFPPKKYKDCREWLNAEPTLSKNQIVESLTEDCTTVEPDEDVECVPQKSVAIFSNFKFVENDKGAPRKVGIMAEEIFTQLNSIVDGQLYSLNGKVLFAAIGDHEILLLVKHDDFFSWLDGICKVDWATGGDKISEKRFFLYCLRLCRSFPSIETFPHFPNLNDVFYHHPKLPEEESSPTKLDQLLAMLSPYSCVDSALIKAMIVTVLWGGDTGSRPVFLITGPPDDPGRGVGKSFLARVVSELCGGLMDFNPSENIGRMKTRLLSEGAIGKRVALIDNIKTSKFSWGDLEGLITAPVVSGHQLFVGENQRPNHFTWILTVNGATVSEDIAQRTVVIKLSRPEYAPQWQPNIIRFIDEHRWEIIADAKRIIEQEQHDEE